MIRAYNLKHGINAGKQAKILAVLRAYRLTCARIAKSQWRLFFSGDSFDKYMPIKSIPSELSERYKRNCCSQVTGMLESYISNRQNEFRQIICNSTLREETRKHLFHINKRKLWYAPASKNFSSEELFLARKIMKHVLLKHRKPSYRRVNMMLNANVATIIAADKTKASGFDYWIDLSTLDKGKKIKLPLKSNPYFDSKAGKVQNTIQINESDGDIKIWFTKDALPKQIEFKSEVLGIDIGLKTMFALNNGNLLGQHIYAHLKHYDTIITDLSSNRQRQELKTKSPRYNSLVKKLDDYLKNEIGRLLNRIVSKYAPKKLIIENLDFRNQNLSKQMNRLVSRFGKKHIENKLQSLHEEYGIEIQYIPAPYSSQECSECHYVDAKNRKTQVEFECRNCHRKIHADVNGARIHVARSSDGELSSIYLGKKKILHILVMRFVK